jgi:hypothetical protein
MLCNGSRAASASGSSLATTSQTTLPRITPHPGHGRNLLHIGLLPPATPITSSIITLPFLTCTCFPCPLMIQRCSRRPRYFDPLRYYTIFQNCTSISDNIQLPGCRLPPPPLRFHSLTFPDSFSLKLCGQWAGTDGSWNGSGCAASTGKSTCAEYVSGVGSNFAESFWAVNYVKYFSQNV